MLILIISDIHANHSALEAVLAEAQSYEAVWCLGDIVGYGPDPNECVQAVRNLPNLTCLMGNHDAAVLGLIETNAFNPEARMVVNWTREVLEPHNKEFLAQQTAKLKIEEITLAHASPRYPIWEYLLDTHTADENFSYFDTEVCLVGHTHVPIIYHHTNGGASTSAKIPEPNSAFALPIRVIANPGSVGQPRDRDPRAAYVIFDSESYRWEYHRVAYDVPAVQQRMEKLALPERHIRRLSGGW
jgi:diadenosine tetraphosphatase ApaH/serine/threonine PP2A family protein phosphatase